MSGDGAADTARLLQEGVDGIVRLRPDELEVGPFSAFRTGVARASSGREGTPEELLGDVGHKDVVLRYLLRLHEGKKMYRKQVAVVLVNLLQVASWDAALQADPSLLAALPDELREQLCIGTPDMHEVPTGTFPTASAPPAASMPTGAGASASALAAAPPAPSAASPPAPAGSSPAEGAAAPPVASVPMGMVAPAATPSAPAPAGTSTSAAAAPRFEPPPRASAAGAGDQAAAPAASVAETQATAPAGSSGAGRPPGYSMLMWPGGAGASTAGADVTGLAASVRSDQPPGYSMLVWPGAAGVPGPAGASASAPDAEPSAPAPTGAELKRAVELAQDRASPGRPSAFAKATSPAPVPTTPVIEAPEPKTLQLVRQGCQLIAALGYGTHDTDSAITAFETFRRGVQQIVITPTKDDDLALDALEPKAQLTEFLVAVHETGPLRKYRLRVDGLVTRLLAFDGWRRAIEADPSARACFGQLLADMREKASELEAAEGSAVVGPPAAAGAHTEGGGEKKATPAAEASRPTTAATPKEIEAAMLTLRQCAAKAAAQGALGVVFVRVIAGYDLVSMDDDGLSDPYVRIKVEGRTQRTEVIRDSLNPRWSSASFVFGVSARDAVVHVECLDDDVVSADPMGEFALRVAELPTEVGRPTRYKLANVAHGELELDVALVLAEGAPAEAARAGAVVAGHAAAPSGTVGPPAAVPAAAPVAAPAAAPAAAATPGMVWAIWATVDPRKGDLNAYPREVAQRLEAAWADGRESLDLGDMFFGASVMLRPKLLQRTAKGSRDVLRLEVLDPGRSVCAFVVKGTDWRITAPSAPGAERRNLLAPAEAVPALPRAPGVADAARGDAGVDDQRWVAWVSVDPRKGDISAYPGIVARVLDDAYHSGKESVDLGATFYGATVQLRPKLLQRTAKGSRDVRRVEVSSRAGPVSVRVVANTGGTWRIAESGEEGSREASLRLKDGEALPLVLADFD